MNFHKIVITNQANYNSHLLFAIFVNNGFWCGVVVINILLWCDCSDISAKLVSVNLIYKNISQLGGSDSSAHRKIHREKRFGLWKWFRPKHHFTTWFMKYFILSGIFINYYHYTQNIGWASRRMKTSESTTINIVLGSISIQQLIKA